MFIIQKYRAVPQQNFPKRQLCMRRCPRRRRSTGWTGGVGAFFRRRATSKTQNARAADATTGICGSACLCGNARTTARGLTRASDAARVHPARDHLNERETSRIFVATSSIACVDSAIS